MHSIGFLVGGRFSVLFCIGQIPPCILWGFLAHSSFCFYIYLLSLPIKKKKKKSKKKGKKKQVKKL